MENATKALLIAAAILIAIVLISLGVYVLSMGQESINSVNMSEQEIMAFNSKFTNYEGKQRGSQVNALAQTVLTNNQAAKDEGSTTSKGVAMSGSINIAADGSTTSYNKVPTGSYYTVSFTYQDGLVHTITVSQ